MTAQIENYTSRLVAIESDIPAWNNCPPQTQRLHLAITEWGTPHAPPENVYLLVHGITANSQWWHALARQMMDASPAPLWIIAPDLRGRGNSDRPPAPYSMASSTADIIGLLNALGIENPVNYVGHSLGAHIGTYFAAHHPERIRRLALVDGGARLPDDVAQSISASMNRLGKVFPSAEAYLDMLKSANIFPNWNSDVERAYAYDCVEVEGGVMSKVDKAAIEDEWRNLSRFYAEVDGYYPRIAAPTVVLRAPEPVVPGLSPFLMPDVVEIITRTVGGGAKVLNVPGTNHYTIVVQPSREMIIGILSA
jgi:pimeloyl-ACP methyl ester carboxylesterase